jgi:hypothetical protein
MNEMGNQSRILTLDNLYQFFVEQNKTVNFSSKDSKQPIVVTVSGKFEESENDMPGMLKLKLKVCHTELNRNGSFISKENMEKAMPSLKYRPILAYIHTTSTGVEDFYAHNIEIVEDEDGEEKINYLERQVGCFTSDEPFLEYDKDMDKTYVIAYAVIPEEYTSAAEIIRRKNGTKVSCELVINELSYNAKEKYLDITDFYFGGTSLLGCNENGDPIGEGMQGARADISDFCHKEPIYTFQDKMVEVLDRLNTTLSNFNNNSKEKGCDKMGKFEELLKQYNVTAEDITFETEGLSDDELEVKFKEAFGESTETSNEPTTTEEENTSTSEGDNSEESKGEFVCKKTCSINEDGNMTVAFDISHEDIRYALFNLISIYETEDDEWYFVSNVYDEYFIFENWRGDKLYKQSYTVDGDNVSLSGDRQEVFKMVLTESEKLAIEKMREDYAALETEYNELKTFKDNYDAAQVKAQKDAIFARDEYSVLAEDEAFKTLMADAAKFSVEEVESKVKSIFADFVIKTGEFSAKKDDKKQGAMHFSTKSVDKTNKNPYGNLFN